MIEIEDQRLLELATLARGRAYAPYSNFAVGAALLGVSGEVYLGCNIENSAYPAGICAERGAFAAAIAAGERDFVRLIVVADLDRPVSPCGICRQVISELAPQARIMLANLDGMVEETTAQLLLPGAFTATDLARSA